MTITWADVEIFAPELSTLLVPAQTDILAHVNSALVSSEWRTPARLRLAQIFLAAHFGTLTNQGSTPIAGPVIKESAGGISRSYANPPTGTNGLERTTYGLMYKQLLMTSAARSPLVLGCPKIP